MTVRNPEHTKLEQSVVEQAIAALDGNPSPLDMDTRDIGESPSDLDLLEGRPRRRSGVVPIRVACVADEHSGELI